MDGPDADSDVDTTRCVATAEICDDRVDQDCDGADRMAAAEICDDGIDQDCNGADRTATAEICNDGLDQDCDGVDGPVAEICSDGMDQDCDGADLTPCPAIDVEAMAGVLRAMDGFAVFQLDALPGGGVAFTSPYHVYAWFGAVVGPRFLDEAPWVVTPRGYARAVTAVGSDGDLAFAYEDGRGYVDTYRFGAADPYLHIESHPSYAHFLDSGDLTGDGVADIVYEGCECAGTFAMVVDGARAGPVAAGEEDARVAGGPEDAWLAYSVHVLGDTDGDGLDDLAVNALPDVRIFRGPLRGTIDLDAADVVVNGDSGGHRVSEAGDLNGDGLADILLHGSPLDNGVAAMEVAADGELGLDDAFATMVCEPPMRFLSISEADVEVNGDAYDDFALEIDVFDEVDGYLDRNVWLYRGPVAGVLPVAEAGLKLSMSILRAADLAVTDLDGDGLNEILTHEETLGSSAGAEDVYVVPGDLLWR